MSITKSKYGRRFDEEFKREVADLASKPGAKQEQVARDLGVESLQRGALEKAVCQRIHRCFYWRQRAGTGAREPGVAP